MTDVNKELKEDLSTTLSKHKDKCISGYSGMAIAQDVLAVIDKHLPKGSVVVDKPSIPIAELKAFIEENKDEYLSSDDIIGFSIEVYELQALIDKYKL